MSEKEHNGETLAPSLQNTENHKSAPIEGKETRIRPRPKLEGEELKATLLKQVEYYFSKENLQSDWYLLSQMDSEMSVPVKTIADFRMVKNLTTDLELVTNVMRESALLAVDDSGIRVGPKTRSFRNTLILRDIPSSTDPQEVRRIFDDIKGPNNLVVEIKELTCEIGDCWYVTFESDDIALMVLEALRGLRFKDQPIQARIKTETVVRNYFVPGAPVMDPNGNPYVYPYQGVYMMPYPPGNYQYWDGRGYRGGSFESQRGRGYGRGRRRDFTNSRGAGRGASQTSKESNLAPVSATSNRKRRGSQGNSTNIPLGTADFPPLPSAAFELSKTRYTEDFIKYSKQEIVDIIGGMSKDKIIKPQGMGVPSVPEKIVTNESFIELEVTKPYPRRATAADIVQMTSPKGPKEAPVFETNKSPRSPKERQSSPEKTTSNAKSEKIPHNGSVTKESIRNSIKVEGIKDNTTSEAKISST